VSIGVSLFCLVLLCVGIYFLTTQQDASKLYLLSFVVSLTLGVFCFFWIYYRVEKFVSNRVKDIYEKVSPASYPQFEKSIAVDVASLTSSLQKFTTDQKTEIGLLKERENYRREFIGNVSHELKTPLFTIQGYILTLIEGAIKDKKVQEKYLKRAAKGVERLIFIIKDLDLITQFEAGVQNLELRRFDILELIRNVFELLEMQAQKNKIKLQFDQEYTTPIWVTADEERIMQVVTNLVVNSLKYGVKSGTTEIGFSEIGDNKILVSVRDNGDGIEEDHLPRLFERFYRVDKSGNRKQGGSGLGLSIVKHIIEAHEEKLIVNSTLGVGSEFSFSLSLAKE